MKRFSYAILLTLLSSTAHASGYSFSIGGHHIYIEAGRHCRSLSCVSWSESGSRRSHRDDDEVAAPAKPVAVAPVCPPVAAPAPAAATPAAPESAAPRIAPAPVAPPIPAPPPAPVRAQVPPAQVAPAPLVPPAPAKPAPIVQAQAPSTLGLAAANAQPVTKAEVVTGKPKEKATVEATVADKPVDTPDWAKDWSPPKDASAPARTAEKPTKVVAHEDDSPVGDWQTEGKKGLVRIETCGAALCGYILNEATNTTAETVLSNMKLKTGTQWSGDIYSRASGNTYYARMTFKQPDTLRVEACAISRFLCSGNDWTRVPRSDEMVTSRDQPAAPKS
jgi:uncharacterized protein (DUF2147 family)